MQESNHTNALNIDTTWTLPEIFRYVRDVEQDPTEEWVSGQEFDDHLWLCGLVLSYDMDRLPSMITMIYDFTQLQDMCMTNDIGGLNKLFPHIFHFDENGTLHIMKYVARLSKYLSSLLHGRIPKLNSINERDWPMIRILLLMERIKMASHVSKFPDVGKARGNMDIGYSILMELYKANNVKHVSEIYSIRILNGIERDIRMFGQIKTLDNLRLRLFMKVVNV